ncbi:MAG: transposase [Psychromonas sp.]|nr:transposase [Psychromonas sp.]
MLTDLQKPGLKNILIYCIDELSGFPEVIAIIFQNTEVNLTIIHQICTSMKYVESKN